MNSSPLTSAMRRCPSAIRWATAKWMPVRSSPRLDPFKQAIDDMLRADLDAPRKQRHTARRVLARLVDDTQGAEIVLTAGWDAGSADGGGGEGTVG